MLLGSALMVGLVLEPSGMGGSLCEEWVGGGRGTW